MFERCQQVTADRIFEAVFNSFVGDLKALVEAKVVFITAVKTAILVKVNTLLWLRMKLNPEEFVVFYVYVRAVFITKQQPGCCVFGWVVFVMILDALGTDGRRGAIVSMKRATTTKRDLWISTEFADTHPEI